MQVFYLPELSEKTSHLDAQNSHHCVRVLRMKSGQTIHITNGDGLFIMAKIILPDPEQCRIKILDTHKAYKALPYHLHIAIAPTKSIDRFEWFLEKSTEIGVSQISPILCSRSERKIIKIKRSEKILESAMKQSGRAYLPKINEIKDFSTFIKHQKANKLYIAHCRATKPHLYDIVTPGTSDLVLIGPEGDFTPEEINHAKSNQFIEVNLGSNRFRTETAALSVCQIYNLRNL